MIMTEVFNPFSLSGKTILVTGASSGIGRGIAEACAKMGATIVLTGRNEERLVLSFADIAQIAGTPLEQRPDQRGICRFYLGA